MIEEVLIEAGLSVELIEKAFEATSEAVYERGTRILEIGEECKNIFIVQEGLLRMFYYGSKGNEITHWFTTENNLMTAPKSFFEGTRSQYAIETLEECTVRKLELKTLNQLCEEHQEFERFMRLLVIRMFMEMNNKVMDLQFKTAKERYLSLIERHPDIFQRVNLGHIASYIGITIQSLSRIRAEVSQS